MMIGVLGTPLTDSFQWAKWRRTKRELRALGATEILTDAEAQRRGYAVRAARSHAMQMGEAGKRPGKAS